MPAFCLAGEALEAVSDGKGLRELKALTASLRLAQPIAAAPREQLGCLATTHRLASMVARAAAQGSANLLVGRLRFPSGMALTVDEAFEAQALLGRNGRAQAPNDWPVSEDVPLPCGCKAAVGERGEDGELNLRLAWKGNSALLSVAPRGRQGAAGASSAASSLERFSTGSQESSTEASEPVDNSKGPGRQLAIDVSSLSQAPLLVGRDTRVRVGGSWHKVNGVCAAGLSKEGLAQALEHGLICVICIREAVGPAPAKVTCSASALALEVSRASATQEA